MKCSICLKETPRHQLKDLRISIDVYPNLCPGCYEKTKKKLKEMGLIK